jgi:hypothetical protein
MSYNDLYAVIRLENTSGEQWYKLGTIDFHGWRYLSVPLNTLPDDESVFRFDRFMVMEGDKSFSMKGTIRFDNLLRAECSGIDEVSIAGLKVKCEGDYIVASADTWIQGLELLDIQGHTIKTAGGNCLNVSGMAPGVYLVRVHINGRTASYKIRL